MDNINIVLNQLDKMTDTSIIQRALTDFCLKVEREAKKECPVDDGQLRASITHEVEVNSNEVNAAVGTNVEYAPYVELGTGLYAKEGNGRNTPWSYQDAKGEWHTTSGQSPQPFLYPALEGCKEELSDCVMRRFKENNI